jgi:DNA/RNA-binding domain of Phe-tRNA-synthetase-like protein
MKKIIIDKEIFEAWPDFKRGLIIVKKMENPSSLQVIAEILTEEAKKRSGEDNLNNPLITAWEQAYLKFNTNPNKFPPSIKSLIKRVQKGGQVPFINAAVALFNYISLKYLLPCGGDDTDTIAGNLRLGFAEGVENFTALGGTEQENPAKGEVIYFDDQEFNIMCRRWNWRNGDFSKITENTRQAVINIDGIGEGVKFVDAARNELAELMRKECRAELLTDSLAANKREIIILDV